MTNLTMALSRDIDAPRPLVYAAWTEAEHLKHWYVPQGFTTILCEVDARVGGCFRIHWTDKSGATYPNKGEYLELNPHDRIVYVDTFDDDRADNQPTKVTVELEDIGGKTRLTSTSTFASKEYMEKLLAMGVEQGWNMFMDQMVAYAENAK